MGIRVSKSFKVAPGIRFRVNAKSTSVSVGGKGMRYTVNSKGTRTATVKVPGTGVSVQQVSRTQKSIPQQHLSEPAPNVITRQSMPKPDPSAPKGEKRLYKILTTKGLSAAQWAAQCERAAEEFPDQRIAATTLAGLFSLTEDPTRAIRTLGYVVDSGVEIAEDSFLQKYSPVTAYAMDAGGGRKEYVPLHSALIVGWLATVYMVAGHLDQAEATAAVLTDTPVTRELRRKIAAARQRAGSADQSWIIASMVRRRDWLVFSDLAPGPIWP